MREIDRIAIARRTPNLYQMMENAGRALACLVIGNLGRNWRQIPVSVYAGSGGNGGGGIVAARTLANWGGDVALILSRDLTGHYSRRATQDLSRDPGSLRKEQHLRGRARGRRSHWLRAHRRAEGGDRRHDRCDTWRQRPCPLSLDIPSGVDGDTGEAPGAAVRPDQTLTLALPKIGLAKFDVRELWLADLGIPAGTFRRAGVEPPPHIFEDGPLVRLLRGPSQL
jgi:NAD(P)H-hydrate epimerase